MRPSYRGFEAVLSALAELDGSDRSRKPVATPMADIAAKVLEDFLQLRVHSG